MVKEIVDLWNERKDNLRSNISSTVIESYEDLIGLIVRNILTDYVSRYTVLRSADYQGCLVTLFVRDYSGNIEDFFYSSLDYGSCSSCDTLERIKDDVDDGKYGGIPNARQVDQYMIVALHIIQGMEFLWKN